MVEANPTKVVLDLGCGSGSLLRLLSRVFDDVIGLEIDPGYLTSIASSHIPNITLLNSDGRKLPFRTESIDTIYSIGVLEHISRVQECIIEAHRVLRKGGSFIIGLPIESGVASIFKSIIHKLVNYDTEEKISIVAALKSFSAGSKTERKYYYHVGKDSQLGHIGFRWEDLLNLVRKYFRVGKLTLFPFNSLRTINPYVFLKLVK